MAIENRRHPRVEISWPVTVVTEEGIISGRTENLSFVVTLIQCSNVPDLLCTFRLVFKPSGRQQIMAIAQRIWSETQISDRFTFHIMGVSFTYIPEHDRNLMTEAISNALWNRTMGKCSSR